MGSRNTLTYSPRIVLCKNGHRHGRLRPLVVTSPVEHFPFMECQHSGYFQFNTGFIFRQFGVILPVVVLTVYERRHNAQGVGSKSKSVGTPALASVSSISVLLFILGNLLRV